MEANLRSKMETWCGTLLRKYMMCYEEEQKDALDNIARLPTMPDEEIMRLIEVCLKEKYK